MKNEINETDQSIPRVMNRYRKVLVRVQEDQNRITLHYFELQIFINQRGEYQSKVQIPSQLIESMS
jgi:hypothetical protein